MLTRFGLWDQLRVDHGREWCLMLYINSTLSHLRGDSSKQPHLQTSSTKVGRIQFMENYDNYVVVSGFVEPYC